MKGEGFKSNGKIIAMYLIAAARSPDGENIGSPRFPMWLLLQNDYYIAPYRT
jgi:hypothetical protein